MGDAGGVEAFLRVRVCWGLPFFLAVALLAVPLVLGGMVGDGGGHYLLMISITDFIILVT